MPEAGAHHQQADRRDGQKGSKGQHMDIADERHWQARQRAAFQRARHAFVASGEIKAERCCRCRRDVERNAGHDEVGAETVDRNRHDPAEKRACNQRGQKADGRTSCCRTGQNGDERRHKHHAFHADIQNAGAVGNHHAERRQQKRRRNAQDRANEGWIENLGENGAHACSPICRSWACSSLRLRKLRITRSTVG
jgi:hypothetical protein